jgi:primosomal protein N' (replication factor Y)
LVLLPEIALSAQWLDRFRARFGTDPALWHSELSPRTRRITWRAVAEGRAPVLVGARSALFLPFPDLGLIVVDEEHETAFKQEEGVIYHARDMAVVRARLSDAACVLVSATPSLETLTNARAGRYGECHLAARRTGHAVLEPARLCATHALPRLWPSAALSELHGLAGGTPRRAAAAMPPLRPCGSAARPLPKLRCTT